MTTAFVLPTKFAERAFVSVEETADMLGLPAQTVYGHVRTKVLPATKMGKRWLIPVQALRDYFAKPEAEAAA